MNIDWRAWLSFAVESAAYALGVCFVLFLLFMAWMVLEDIIEKHDD